MYHITPFGPQGFMSDTCKIYLSHTKVPKGLTPLKHQFKDQNFTEILSTQKFHILSSKLSQSDTGLQPETQFSFICGLVKPNN